MTMDTNTPDQLQQHGATPRCCAPATGSGPFRQLSQFQHRVLGNLRAGVWYGDIAEDGIEEWPLWMCKRGINLNVTLACLVEAGALEKRMHTYPRGFKWRVFRRAPNTEVRERRPNA